jgi:Xaa-Pro aminopeptidase
LRFDKREGKEMSPRISDKEFLRRVRNTRKRMAKEELDYLIVFSAYPEREGHIEYLTNYHGAFPQSQYDDVYRGLGYSALVLSQTEGPVLFTGVLFAAGRLVGVEKVDSFENLPLAISNFITESLRSSNRTSAKIGFAGEDVIPSLYLHDLSNTLQKKKSLRIQFVDAGELLMQQRMVKSEEEQNVLREGAKIADVGIRAAFEATKSGARELDLGIAASRACYEMGADYVARTRIYGRAISGVRWPIMTNRKLERGEITGIDLVGYYGSYGFDVLRMWTVGNPTSSQKELLNKAALLTELTSKKIRAGMNGDDISNLTTRVSSELEVDQNCEISPFGHAIGLEIVENPLLLPKSQVKVQRGAFLCIEPGLTEQRDQQTIHVEDEIAIRENGMPETVSKCTKQFY